MSEEIDKGVQSVLKITELLNESITGLKQELSNLKGRVTSLEKKTKEEVEVVKGKSEGVPAEILSVVHNLLGEGVSVRVEDDKSGMMYQILLTIPPEMSKSLTQPDIRACYIKYSEGIDALKIWLQKVKNNIAQSFTNNGEAPPQY